MGAQRYEPTMLTIVHTVTYEPFGPLNGLTFGNSLVLARDFDTQYRLTAQTTGAIQDLGFTYDAAGNIDAIADGVDAGLSQTFTQDALHRIDFDSGAYGDIDYSYDAAGNRQGKVVDSVTAQTLTYTSDSNRLATHNSQSVTLDAAGNTTADDGQGLGFWYDDHNRLTEAYVSSTLEATYAYNGQGQRVKKVEATGAERTIVYHYGLNGELIGETIYDDLGSRIGERDYVWLDDLPVGQSERTFSGATVTSDSFVYIHADQLNTPRLATNGSGAVVWRWDSDAFGVGDADLDPDSDTNEVSVRLRFPGQYLDEETGLHYNYFRDYDAVTGRYIQSDPIGLDGGLNTYSYANGNALRFVDVHGLNSLAQCANPVNMPACVAAGIQLSGRAKQAADLLPIVAAIAVAATNLPDDENCNDRCKNAKTEARAAFAILMARVPEYLTGGTRGSDAGHLKAIQQAQQRLESALERVRRHCNPLPLEYAAWEQAANLSIPKLF